MRRHGFIALTMGIAFAAAFGAGSSGCFLPKKVKDIPDDIRQCFGADVKGDLGDLVKGIETALVCELSSGGNALPACVIEGLQTIADEIGPSGKADVQCVIDKIAQDAAARAGKAGLTPEEVVRDQRAKLLSKRGSFALRSPGAGTPPTLPYALQQAAEKRAPGEVPSGRPGGEPSAFEGPAASRAMATCDTYCGAGHGLAVPGGGCECWKGERRAARWVAAQ